MTDTRAPRRARVLLPLGLLLLTAAASGPLWLGQLPAYMDPVLQAYPYHAFLDRWLEAGELPEWNPHQMAGTPFAANPQAGVFYPPRLLLSWLLPAPLAFGWLLGLHALLAAAGSALWLRELRVSRAGALLGAAVFLLGGQLVHKLALPPVYLANAWLPLAFALLERAWRRRSLAAAAGAGGCLAATLLAGYPRSWLLGLGFAAVYLLLRGWPLALGRVQAGRRAALSRLLAWGAWLYLLLLLLWLPLGGRSLEVAGFELSMRGPEKLAQGALGLAVAALLVAARRPRLSWRRMRLGLVLGLVTLLLGVTLAGVQLMPSLELAADTSHAGSSEVREPTRSVPLREPSWHHDLLWGDWLDVHDSLFIGLVPLLLAAGLLLWPGRWRRPGLELGLLALLALLLAGGRLGRTEELLRGLPVDVFATRQWSLVFAALALSGLAALGYERLRLGPPWGPRVAHWLWGLALAQLLFTGPPRLSYASPAELYPETEIARGLASLAGQQRFVAVDAQLSPTRWDRPLARRMLVPNLASYYGADDAAGYDPIQLRSYKRTIAVAEDDKPVSYPGRDRYHFVLPQATGASALMDLLGVRNVLYRRSYRPSSISVYQHRAALPRVWIATRWVAAPDPDLARRWVHERRVRAPDAVVLERGSALVGLLGEAAPGAGPPAISLRGADWALADYAGLELAGADGPVTRHPPLGRGLSVLLLAPAGDGEGGLEMRQGWLLGPGDGPAVERMVAEVEQRAVEGDLLALMSAGGYALGHRPSRAGALVRLGLEPGLVEKLEQARVPLAVAALCRLEASGWACQSELGSFLARLDQPPLRPLLRPLEGLPSPLPEPRLAPREDPDLLRVELEPQPGPLLLVLSETHARGWSLWLDGRRAGPERLGRAYGVLQAALVPAGVGRVELRYHTPGLALGLALSLAGLLLWGLLAWRGGRAR